MRRFLVFIFFLVFTNVPALAGWQYTEWGMSIPDVIKSSKGAVKIKENVEIHYDENKIIILDKYYIGTEEVKLFLIFNREKK